jgi:hypothetical protein
MWACLVNNPITDLNFGSATLSASSRPAAVPFGLSIGQTLFGANPHQFFFYH